MIDLTSLILLFLSALLVYSFLFRRHGAERIHRRDASRALGRSMAAGADICVAAAREAFQVELDHSLGSLAVLDSLLETGWPVAHDAISFEWNAVRQSNPILTGSLFPDAHAFSAAGITTPDTPFVIAAYWGDVFVRYYDAFWEETPPARPRICFPHSSIRVTPWEALPLLLGGPSTQRLHESALALVEQLEGRTVMNEGDDSRV